VNRLLGCIHCIARPDLYSLEQWIALSLSVTCLGVDVYAVFLTITRSTLSVGPFNIDLSGYEAIMWAFEGLVVLAVLGLLAFAFSTRSVLPDIE
jgi:hypothetical protein